MERSQLERLRVSDLKYYTKENSIEAPLNASQGDLINLILGRQAKVLTEKAKKAIEQVNGLPHGATFLNVDVSQLEPHTSAYSSTGAGGSLYSETESGGNQASTVGESRQTGLTDNVDGTERTGQAGLNQESSSPSKDKELHIRKKARRVSLRVSY